MLYCDAHLDFMGYWLLDKCIGYYSSVPNRVTEGQIFYFKALCVLSAIHHVIDVLCGPPTSRILILTDSYNTIIIFNALRCLHHYNPIFINAAEICIATGIHFRVLHILGELNCVANAISQNNFSLAWQYVPSPPFYPLNTAGGSQNMTSSTLHARQPPSQACIGC